METQLKDITYSIVIPAYNEEERLRPTLESVLAYVHQQDWDAEIIVVDDGSFDNTAKLVQEFVERDPMVRLLENPDNRGKGYSVASGMLHARGEFLVFSDADLSSPIEELPKLLRELTKGADIAIGSRWLQTELQTQRQSPSRQFLGRVFNRLLRIIWNLQLKDTQCGFKAFTRRAARAIFPLQRIERWGFDPEILFLAKKFGFGVAEVPVRWADKLGTRIEPLTDGLRMLQEMIRIRYYSLMGKYDARSATGPQRVRAVPGSAAPRV
jgi:dolichyl-phosphate beta-glucosyltransferase